MAAFGTDFQKYTSPLLYVPSNPAGLWAALGLALALLIANSLLQTVAGMGALSLFFDAGAEDQRSVIKSFIIGIFPASILTAIMAWQVAKIRGGNPREVLALRWPDLGWLGWLMCHRRIHGCDVRAQFLFLSRCSRSTLRIIRRGRTANRRLRARPGS